MDKLKEHSSLVSTHQDPWFSRLPSFLQPFFSTWDRTSSTFSVIASALSVIISVIIVNWPEGVPSLLVLRDIIIVVVLIGLSLFWFGKYTRQALRLDTLKSEVKQKEHEVDELNSTLSFQIQKFHEKVHDFRNITFRDFGPLDNDFSPLMGTQELKSFQQICNSITRNAKESLQLYFRSRHMDLGDTLSVSVKIILPTADIVNFYQQGLSQDARRKIQEKKEWVVTAYRDPETWARGHREAGQNIYDIDRNTAFIHLMRARAPKFVCDDLVELEKTSGYENENPNWRKQYNSTMVVPVRYRNIETDDIICFGALAVDSLNPNKYPLFEGNDDAFHIMAHATDVLVNFYLTLNLYQSGLQEQKEGTPHVQ